METFNLDQKIPYETYGHSSKGNQLKWKADGYWYKADHTGYEGLSEVIISRLLQRSNLTDSIDYESARIQYKEKTYNGCRSRNFLSEAEELITVDRLFRQYTGTSLTTELAHISSVRERIAYLVNSVQEFTGIKDFGRYMAMTLELDAFFLNEDRHTNNIAVIYNPVTKKYRTCPHFDNGLALFSDTDTDFPLEKSLTECYKVIRAKPFSLNFDEQADEAAHLYGPQLKLDFKIKDILDELEKFRNIYENRIIDRVELTLREQMRKYQNLFN